MFSPQGSGLVEGGMHCIYLSLINQNPFEVG